DSIDDLLGRVHVVALPMHVRFRGVTKREVALVEGPAGWGEFGAFPEYPDPEAVHWLRSALEMGWRGPPAPRRRRVAVNATVPAVAAGEVAGVLERFPGCTTVKVKVAEEGQELVDDVARVAAILQARPGARVRVDANGGWAVAGAAHATRGRAPGARAAVRDGRGTGGVAGPARAGRGAGGRGGRLVDPSRGGPAARGPGGRGGPRGGQGRAARRTAPPARGGGGGRSAGDGLERPGLGGR